MRVTLRDGTEQVVQRIARVIEAGVADGSIPPMDAPAIAQTLYQLWLGASLIGKLHRDGAALANAMAFTRSLLAPEFFLTLLVAGRWPIFAAVFRRPV
jgi:TetR/AcrR family transcriptional repressor of nem operon